MPTVYRQTFRAVDRRDRGNTASALAAGVLFAISVFGSGVPALAEAPDLIPMKNAHVSTHNEAAPIAVIEKRGTMGCAIPARGGADVQATVQQVNAQRRANGLGPLRLSTRLSHVAQAHACDNAARNIYSHFGSDGSDLRTRLKRGGYALRVAAENTAIGFADPLRAVSFWMRSPHHRDNILNPRVTEIGVGLAAGSRPNWVLVMAASR